MMLESLNGIEASAVVDFLTEHLKQTGQAYTMVIPKETAKQLLKVAKLAVTLEKHFRGQTNI